MKYLRMALIFTFFGATCHAEDIAFRLSDRVKGIDFIRKVNKWIEFQSNSKFKFEGIDELNIYTWGKRDPGRFSLLANTGVASSGSRVERPYRAVVETFSADSRMSKLDVTGYFMIIGHEISHHHNIMISKIGGDATSEVDADRLSVTVFFKLLSQLPESEKLDYLRESAQSESLIDVFRDAASECKDLEPRDDCLIGMLASYNRASASNLILNKRGGRAKQLLSLSVESTEKFKRQTGSGYYPSNQCRLDISKNAVKCYLRKIPTELCPVNCLEE